MQAEHPQPESDQLLRQVEHYREEYRAQRRAALIEERGRRQAAGESYIAGLWLPRAQAERVHRTIARQQLWIGLEVLIAIVCLAATAWGMWRVFRIFFMPA